MRKNIKIIIFFSYLIYLSYLSLKSSTSELPPFAHFDKLAHFLAHLLLTVLSYWTWTKMRKAFLISLLYGVVIEGVQHFLPTRSSDILDLVANVSGMLMGILIYNWFIKKN